MNIMYIGSNDYNYVYWKHSLQANTHNRIFGTFTRIRTSNMRIFTFSIFVPTYIYAICRREESVSFSSMQSQATANLREPESAATYTKPHYHNPK